MDDRPTVNIDQAMRLLGLSRRTIYNRLASTMDIEYKRVGTTIRIYTDQLEKMQRIHREAPRPTTRPD